ncbi:MAG TPA: VWA domain-containing protein [Vicinamibacterales bacterium]|jgi:VWFA-related protein|nr:VWA domain-containing protein [Vicinamibacterales bacterium]
MRTLFVACAVVVGISSHPAQAQDASAPPAQGPTFRSGVDLVTVDVGVVDPSGNPVNDLRPADFTVKIDGQPRRVVTANLVRVDVEAAKKKLADKEETFFTTNLTPPEGRQIIFAVDQVNVRTGSLKTLMRTAASFLDRLSPLDQVAFRSYPDPGARVPFTTDRLRVKLAMDTLLGHQDGLPASRNNIGVTEAVAITERQDRVALNTVTGRECSSARTAQEVEQCRRDLELQADDVTRRARAAADEGLSGLLDLLRQLAYVDGSKTLILLSEGLAVNDPADLDLVAILAGRARVAINILILDDQQRDIDVQQVSPTADDDRRRLTTGLQNIAAASRGSVFHAVGTAEGVFDRLLREISAYYVLGVEQRPGDEDDKRRRVDVAVGRRNVTVRSPQAFAVSNAARPNRSPDDNLRSALESPFAVAEIPLRVTAFAQQEPTGGKVRLSIAADIGQPGAPPAAYSVAYVLTDRDNHVVTEFARKITLTSQSQRPTETLAFVGTTNVEPGIYTLHFAVVDAAGRRGSVIREVSAWKMLDEELALSDLVVDGIEAAGQGLRMAVEPHIASDGLAAVVDVYSSAPTTLSSLSTTFEIADDQNAPAVATVDGSMRPGTLPSSRVAQAVIPTTALPPGRYVARVRVTRDGKTVNLLARPFVLEKNAAPAGAVPVPVLSYASRIQNFDRDAVMAPPLVASMLDVLETRSATLKPAVTEARAGRYGAAALEALSAGDQDAASFLRGLDLLIKGQLDQAATQLQIAAGPRRQFFPAAFYLGAVFASVGRDRDAAGTWQLAIGNEPRPAITYMLAADARLRDGSPGSAVDILKPAYARLPTDDEIGRRLAMAYLMTSQYAEALGVLDGYLSRHPTDQDLLFGAVVAQYELAKGGQVLSNAERERVRKWADAYRGDERALVDKYVQAIGAR